MKEAKTQNAIRLISTQVLDLNFSTKKVFDKSITDNLNLNVKHGISFPSDNSKNFVVTFNVDLFDESEDFSLFLKYVALFETNLEIDESFKNSSFIQFSSPAIAFPFLRSFISTLTINSGFNPIIFPALNFTDSK